VVVFGNFRIFLDVGSSGSNPFEMKKNWQGVLWASLILVLTIGLLMEVMAQHLQLMVKHKRRQQFLGHKMMHFFSKNQEEENVISPTPATGKRLARPF